MPPSCVGTCFNEREEKITNSQVSNEHIIDCMKTSDAADRCEDDKISNECYADDDRYIHYLCVPQDHGVSIGRRRTVKDKRMRKYVKRHVLLTRPVM